MIFEEHRNLKVFDQTNILIDIQKKVVYFEYLNCSKISHYIL